MLPSKQREKEIMATSTDPDNCVVNIFSGKTFQTDQETTETTNYYSQDENSDNSANITQQKPEVFAISGKVQMQVETAGCKGCDTNFCSHEPVKTPHPTGSTCVHTHAGVHGEGNNNQMNVYNRPVPNNQRRNRPGRERMIPINMLEIPNDKQEKNRPHIERMNTPIKMHDQPLPDNNQAFHMIKVFLKRVAMATLYVVITVYTVSTFGE